MVNLDLNTIGLIVAPVGTGTVLWFFIKAWMSTVRRDISESKHIAERAFINIDAVEDELLTKIEELKNLIQSIKIEIAESGIKRTADDVDRLKEKSIKFEGQMQAAWRALENLGGRDKRLSD